MSPKKKAFSSAKASNIALCYVRQSFTRDEDDKDSPERQRANIERVCAGKWVARRVVSKMPKGTNLAALSRIAPAGWRWKNV